MIRVFAAPAGPGPLELSREESRYLVRVRRARVGEAVEVLDGRGAVFDGRVLRTGPRRAVVEVVAGPRRPTDPGPRLHLAVAVPSAQATAEVLAAATALGVASIRLLATERAQPHGPSHDRIDRILRATLRQCGRPAPPPVEGPCPLAEALDGLPSPRFLAAPGAPHPGRWRAAEASLFVGPEGGFTDHERALLEGAGCLPVGLGPHTLTTPLAVAAGLAGLRAAGPA